MENINKLIEKGELEPALKMINDKLSTQNISETDDYHFLLFAIGRIYMIKYSKTVPVDNSLFYKARDHFAMADNAYRAKYDKHHPDYELAINTAQSVFRSLNPAR